MNSFKKFFGIVSAFAMMGVITGGATYSVNAAEETVSSYTYTHWFGSGYRRYESGITYDVEIRRDGEVYVKATCNEFHTADELDGDFIKFGSIAYDSSIYTMEYEYEDFHNALYMYTEDTVLKTSTTKTLWSRHQPFGMKPGSVFELWLKPVKTEFSTQVTIIDEPFSIDTYATAEESIATGITPETAPEVKNTTAVTEDVKDAPETAPKSTTASAVGPYDPPHLSLNKDTTTASETTTTVVTTTTTTVTVPTKVDLDFVTSTVASAEETQPATEPETTEATTEETTTIIETTVATTTETTKATTAATEIIVDAPPTLPKEEDYSIFDVNKDGYVNFNDIVSLLNFLFSK